MLNSFATLPGVDTHHQLVISRPSTQLDYRRCTNTYHQSVTVPALDYCSFMADLITSMDFSSPRPPPMASNRVIRSAVSPPITFSLLSQGFWRLPVLDGPVVPGTSLIFSAYCYFLPPRLAYIHDTGTALIFRVLRAPRLFELHLIRSTLVTA